MKKNIRQHILIIGVFLVVGIIFTKISYSYIEGDLKLNGNTKVLKNSWDVHFDNIKYLNKSDSSSEVEISDTNETQLEFKVDLKEVKDYYEFNIDVVNSGNYDLKLDNLLKSTLEDDESENVEYIVTYLDGDTISIGDLLPKNSKETLRIITRYKNEDKVKEHYELYLFLKLTYVQDDGKGLLHNKN